MNREGRPRRWYEESDGYAEDSYAEEQHTPSHLTSPAIQERPMLTRDHQTTNTPPHSTQHQSDIVDIIWAGPDDAEVLRNLIAYRYSPTGSEPRQAMFGHVAEVIDAFLIRIDALLTRIDRLETQNALLLARLGGTWVAMLQRNVRQ